jgi:hypothetical protein
MQPNGGRPTPETEPVDPTGGRPTPESPAPVVSDPAGGTEPIK